MQCCVYASDVAALNPGTWLNDNVVSYAFEYLEQQQQPEAPEQSHASPSLRFVSPTVSLILRRERDIEDLRDTVMGCRVADAATQRQHAAVLFPVSDASGTTVGGTHWSLLAWSVVDGCFFYFDWFGDGGSGNTVLARELAAQVHPYLSAGDGDDGSSGAASGGDGDGTRRCAVHGNAAGTDNDDGSERKNDDDGENDVPFVMVPSPVQPNGFDCGVYTIVVAHAIGLWQQQLMTPSSTPSCHCWRRRAAELSAHLRSSVTPACVREQRRVWQERLRAHVRS